MSGRFKRNFVVATIIHVAIIASVVVWENVLGNFGRPALASVALYTPADILGDLPKGAGRGRGNYKPPEPAGADTIAGPNGEMLTPDESHVPAPKPDEVLIPKKTPTKKPVVAAKPSTSTAKKPVVATKPATTTGTAKGPSADDIKNRFAKALSAAEDGTPYGNGQKAGGGAGRGRIGSPAGAADGQPGGVGQGSANWKYFDHVHDVMYQAWEQPGSALDRKLIATVQLRVARDGTVTDASLRVPSGNKVMDESVLAATRKVLRLDPPPDNLVRGETANITIDFQVEG